MATARPGSSLAPPQSGNPGRPILLKIPLPPLEVSPNFRPRFKAEKFNAQTAYRAGVEIDARNLRIAEKLRAPLAPPVGARIVYVVATNVRRDPDNLLAQLKGAIDGLVHARLLVDDSVGKLTIREIGLVAVKGLREGYVAIELECYEPTQDPAALAYRIKNGGT
jgi:Holliday junction resolvase RusA-like endonuclease